MPRGVRGSVDYDVQIEKIDERIERYSKLIAGLNKQREELLEKKQAIEMKGLYIYMNESGLTANDVLTILKK